MNISLIPYNIIIRPVELLLGILTRLLWSLTDGNIPLLLLLLSLAVSLLTLPLYQRAERVGAEERARRDALEPMIRHIRRCFSGDERTLTLSAYYRIAGYSPLKALRASLSSLLQLPFFIAAWHFLSNADFLKGVSFGPIESLEEADGLLTAGAIRINLLPILMTLVNLYSALIYTKGRPLREKLRAMLLPLLFLLLLYKSPSGLVIYWLCGNLFSLIRNILSKKDAAPSEGNGKDAGKIRFEEKTAFSAASDRRLFIASSLYLTLLAGAWIPLSVVSASPQDFVNVYRYIDPFRYVAVNFCVYAGLFLFWGSVIQMLLKEKGKAVYNLLLAFTCIFCSAEYFFLDKTSGTISALLVYAKPTFPGYKRILMGCGISIALAVCLLMLLRRRLLFILRLAFFSGCTALILLSGRAFLYSRSEIGKATIVSRAEDDEVTKLDELVTPIIPLDQNGRNVIIIMLDRAVSSYLPYILNEKPELKASLDGFVWYPNTLSTGGNTRLAAPALYGGYDYTPEEMERRSDESLNAKHDEALKVLPVLFSNEGYRVNVCDPPYAGGQEIPDLSIFNDCPGVETHLTNGLYSTLQDDMDVEKTTEYNFLLYSLMKLMPLCLREGIYDHGHYLSPAYISRDVVPDGAFGDAWSVLDLLPELTSLENNGTDSFFIMKNDTAHEPRLLQLPDYLPLAKVDNSAWFDASVYELEGEVLHLDNEEQLTHYQVNMAALLKLCEWFDYLKEQSVYDNCRIIIAADHGTGLKQLDRLQLNEDVDAAAYNPLLLVKDFDAHGFSVCDDFMCNADVPALATEGLIENARNPFTGTALQNDSKNSGVAVSLSDNGSIKGRVLEPKGYAVDTSDRPWYRVVENLFDPACWTKIRD